MEMERVIRKFIGQGHTVLAAKLYFKLTQNKPNGPKGPENITCTMMMYGGGGGVTAATGHNTSCSEDNSSE